MGRVTPACLPGGLEAGKYGDEILMDLSLTFRESIGSGGSDMVIIERTMAGMYKVLDAWLKQILPLSPHQSLQESLLHILQEQEPDTRPSP